MPTITFIDGDQKYTTEGKSGETILQIGLDAGVPIDHACGGNGFCTTCLCNIKEGKEHVNERHDKEENMGITDDPERLSCQAKFLNSGDVVVELTEV